MEDLKNIYIEEANELLTNLEIALLVLEENPNDKANIEQIFRIMHTLKGNSSMFGLNIVTDFVHNLETIYDKIRNEEMTVSKELLNCSLKSLDHLRKIIYDSNLEEIFNKHNHTVLSNTINDIINIKEVQKEELTPCMVSNDNHKKVYYIYFKPAIHILEHGFNPLMLIMELNKIGKIKVVPLFEGPESIEEYNPTHCYSSWTIFLETTSSKETILDIFVFIEGSAQIEVRDTEINDLFEKNLFLESIRDSKSKNQLIEYNSIKKLNQREKNQEYKIQINESLFEKDNNRYEKNAIKKEKSISNIRVSSDKLDELMNLVSELVTTQASLTLFTESNKITELESISENVEKLSRRLRDIAFGMTLIPINNMFGKFQRMVRDMANSLNKEIEFITEGGETELDKSIIDTLTDPLMHILRNCIDHGIEKPEQRLKSGKLALGKITLKAYYSGVFVYIQISDDGKGLDFDVIKSKAIEKGLIKNDDVLTEKEIHELLFAPGFSTAEKITDISGRGVGMDVVKKNITDLKGEILLSSMQNHGTTFTIKLPLTLSIIDGLLVDIDGVKYIIPLSVVIKCFEIHNKNMTNNFNKLLQLDGEQIPFINLKELFGYSFNPNAISQLIVVSNSEDNIGLSVDYIVGEYQAVIKPLGKYYKNQDFVSGATILGDGTIALVLDTHKIVQLYTKNIKIEESI